MGAILTTFGRFLIQSLAGVGFFKLLGFGNDENEQNYFPLAVVGSLAIGLMWILIRKK